MSIERGQTAQGQTAALGEMRAARRRRFVEQLDLMEVLYRVYLGVIFGGIALAVIAGWVEEAPATAAAIADMRSHGPAVLGMTLALAILVGLRSGSRGGPLAIEAAEVQYVLLAPIDRGTALRPAALRQLRIAVLAGAVLGARHRQLRLPPAARLAGRVDRLSGAVRRAAAALHPLRGAARLGPPPAAGRGDGDRDRAGRLVARRPPARHDHLAGDDGR